MKPLVTALIVATLSLPTLAQASLQDGLAAYERQDYAIARGQLAAVLERPGTVTITGLQELKGLDQKNVPLRLERTTAVYTLSMIYFHGQGVRKNPVVAYALMAYLAKKSPATDRTALYIQGIMATKMTRNQIARADNLVKFMDDKPMKAIEMYLNEVMIRA
ncbi:hypothetical protein ACYPKM_04120 [Pseudomonas aeruginosa]